jgi:crotonobetainyl-CoA:carnitine CoA-transferase CaiB-like acyl-CoA transferase
MDEDFPENWLQLACTPDRVDRTRKHLSEWLADVGKHEAAEEAQKRGVMIVPLNNPGDLMENAQFRHRDYFAKVDHPVLGEAMYPGVPYRMSATPAAIDAPAPLLGEMGEPE